MEQEVYLVEVVTTQSAWVVAAYRHRANAEQYAARVKETREACVITDLLQADVRVRAVVLED